MSARPGLHPRTLGARAVAVWFVVFGAVLVWSAIAPKERYTWWLEVAPALIAFAILGVARLGAATSLTFLARRHDAELRRFDLARL